jgi:glycosyltransferase involved in cell wall biosynthesis
MLTETAAKVNTFPTPDAQPVEWLSLVPREIEIRGVRVSVVVPAMNEAENLPHVLPRIPAWVEEVILVDGHSTDNTVEVARELLPDIRVVEQTGKGKGAALRSGFQAASGDIIVMIDADGSTDPAEIPAYVGSLLAGADYAKGSRYLQGGGSEDISLFRSLGNSGLLFVTRMLFGFRYTDLCYGYNAFWRRVLPALDLDADGFEIETLMNLRAGRAGLRVAEVPSFESRRIFGESRLRAIPDGWRVLKTIVRERAKRPAKQHAADRAEAGRIAFLPATSEFVRPQLAAEEA